jgi:hypothetical protein
MSVVQVKGPWSMIIITDSLIDVVASPSSPTTYLTKHKKAPSLERASELCLPREIITYCKYVMDINITATQDWLDIWNNKTA